MILTFYKLIILSVDVERDNTTGIHNAESLNSTFIVIDILSRHRKRNSWKNQLSRYWIFDRCYNKKLYSTYIAILRLLCYNLENTDYRTWIRSCCYHAAESLGWPGGNRGMVGVSCQLIPRNVHRQRILQRQCKDMLVRAISPQSEPCFSTRQELLWGMAFSGLPVIWSR